MLESCADIVVIREEYQPSVYSHRNRYMVEHSDRVIAVYDGRENPFDIDCSATACCIVWFCTNIPGHRSNGQGCRRIAP